MVNFLLDISGIKAQISRAFQCMQPRLDFVLGNETRTAVSPKASSGEETLWEDTLVLKYDTSTLVTPEPKLLVHLLDESERNQKHKGSGYFPLGNSLSNADLVIVPLVDPHGIAVGEVRFDLLVSSSGQPADSSTGHAAAVPVGSTHQTSAPVGQAPVSETGTYATNEPQKGSSVMDKARTGAVQILTAEQKMLERIKPKLPGHREAQGGAATDTSEGVQADTQQQQQQSSNPLKKILLFGDEGVPPTSTGAEQTPTASGGSGKGFGTTSPQGTEAPLTPSPVISRPRETMHASPGGYEGGVTRCEGPYSGSIPPSSGMPTVPKASPPVASDTEGVQADRERLGVQAGGYRGPPPTPTPGFADRGVQPGADNSISPPSQGLFEGSRLGAPKADAGLAAQRPGLRTGPQLVEGASGRNRVERVNVPEPSPPHSEFVHGVQGVQGEQGEEQGSPITAGMRKALLIGEPGGTRATPPGHGTGDGTVFQTRAGTAPVGVEQTRTGAQGAPTGVEREGVVGQSATRQAPVGGGGQGPAGGEQETGTEGITGGMKTMLLFGEGGQPHKGTAAAGETVQQQAPTATPYQAPATGGAAKNAEAVEGEQGQAGVMDKARMALHDTLTGMQQNMEATKAKLATDSGAARSAP